MLTTLTLDKTAEGLFVPSELVAGWKQVEAIRYPDYVVLRAKSNRTASQRKKVISALRNAGLIVELDWEVPPLVSAKERAVIAQKLSGDPPLSQLVLSEREDRA